MKKKLILSAAVIIIMLGISSTAATADYIYTGINDKVIDPPKGLCPTIINNTVYVPLEIFTEYFGVSYSFENASSYSLLLVKNSRFLAFNIDINLVVDHNNTMQNAALYKTGNTYLVPASFVANFFNINYSYIRTGSIVRFYQGTNCMSDTAFLSANFPPEKIPNPQPEEEEKVEPVSLKSISLAFYRAPSAQTSDILDTLKKNSFNAAFFLTERYIKENPELVIRMIAEGHTIGLNIAVPADKDRLMKSIKQCSNTLERIAKVNSPFIHIEGSSKSALNEEMRNTLTKAGYRLWDYNITSNSIKSSSMYTNIISSLKKRTGKTVLMLPANETTASALPNIIKYMKKEKYGFYTINVNTAPVNRWGDTR